MAKISSSVVTETVFENSTACHATSPNRS